LPARTSIRFPSLYRGIAEHCISRGSPAILESFQHIHNITNLPKPGRDASGHCCRRSAKPNKLKKTVRSRHP
jgi:hypothetical protein